MKTYLYTFKYQQNKINREHAIKLYRALKETRYAFALAISAGKKAGSINNVRYLRDDIKGLKVAYLQEIVRKPISVISRRFNGRLIEECLENHSDRHDALRSIRDLIHRERHRTRDISGDYLANKIISGVYLNFQKKRLSTPKQPNDAGKYVGIEIECITPKDADFSALYPFSKWVDVGRDGSINHEGNETGTELRVCLKREEIREVLPPLLAALQGIGARVNRSCGLHVHLDQRENNEPALAFQKLVRSLNLLYTVVPKSRRKNTFCRRNRHADFQAARNGSRYYAINASAWDRYKTLEIRLFGGTLDADKIINWIETLHAISEGAIVLRCPRSFVSARKYWNLSDSNVAWLEARQTKFASLNALAPDAESDTEQNQILIDEVPEENEEAELEEVA
jgi:hypothetical protein